MPCTWNEKHLDYEIETSETLKPFIIKSETWNEKHLDYEIETLARGVIYKEVIVLKWKASRLRDWNINAGIAAGLFPGPEMKSISITRLKRPWCWSED